MLRSIVMNAIRATSMSDSSKTIRGTGIRGTGIRGIGIRGIHVAGAVFAGILALAATFALPVAAPPQHGGSVHAKNAATPDWIVERQTQNAHQAPVVIEMQEPSFWI
jgi:hypothetical protein